MYNINPENSSVGTFIANTALQTASVTIAGTLRRMKWATLTSGPTIILPTASLFAFAFTQSLVTNVLLEGVKWLERKCGLSAETSKALSVGIYILCQTASIVLAYLIVNNLALAILGYALMYDMNPPSISAFDLGSIFCIVAQSTLVTLFIKSIYDIYQAITKAPPMPENVNPLPV